MKAYQFQLSEQAEREFAIFPSPLQKRIVEKLLFFQKTANPLKYAKKMSGYDNTYRFRIGDYRVIVTPKDTKILVILVILKIGHRKEVYE